MGKTAALPGVFIRELTGPCQVARGSRIICAVSGGPDSMALLYLLAAAREHLDLALTAVWVDHGLRPEETPTEERTVVLAAEKLQIACIRHRFDAASSADQRGISLEHAARDLRYAALRATARKVGAEYIAVAHTADDQAEEILLRLLRGSGREGVAGMRMRSRDLIRPLLNIEKKDLLAWLTEQEIPFCFDSSNDDMRFLRNRVRHRLLPFLEEHFEAGIKKSLRKTADSLAADEALLAALTAEAEEKTISALPSEKQDEALTMRLDRTPFRALHPAQQRRVVERLLWRIGGRAGYDHILLVIKAAESGRTNSELHLGQGLRVGVFRDRLEFSYPAGRKAWRGRLFSDRHCEMQENKLSGKRIIGITGGIGSGKSRVSSFLAEQDNLPLINLDQICRDLLQPRKAGWQALRNLLSDQYFRENDELDRQYFRRRLFANSALREQVDAALHPLARREMEQRIAALHGPVLVEIPLLFEAGWQNDVDVILVVYAEEDVRRQRIMARDQVTEEQARQAIAAQRCLWKKAASADYVIDNSGSWNDTCSQIQQMVTQLGVSPRAE